jgi:hypothetical protein
MAVVVLLTLAVVMPPAQAQQQGDDPAVAFCEARERPRPADPTFRRVAASISQDKVVLVYEVGAGEAARQQEAQCRFVAGWDGAWRFAGDRAESLFFVGKHRYPIAASMTALSAAQ